jgi:hypothetical protein
METLLEAVPQGSTASSEPGRWPESAPPTAVCLAEADGEPLAALMGDTLSPRFCSWRGVSGRRYIVSIYAPQSCPAYCDAVLIAAAVGSDGRRRALALADTGVFPEPLLARMAKTLASAYERVEFHLHLLTSSTSERRAVLDDLARAAPYAARS